MVATAQSWLTPASTEPVPSGASRDRAIDALEVLRDERQGHALGL